MTTLAILQQHWSTTKNHFASLLVQLQITAKRNYTPQIIQYRLNVIEISLKILLAAFLVK